MGASLRNQRLRVYGYSNTGTNGVPAETYTYQAEWWGRLTPLGAKQFTVGLQGEHTVNALASFSDEAAIPEDGAVVLNGAVYFIRGVLTRAAVREIDVLCEFCNHAQPVLVGP